MSFHKVIVSVISIQATFIQTESQSQSSSLFETHCWVMYTFYVVLFTYVVATATITVQVQAAQNRGNDNNEEGALTKVTLLSGALASILLLLIIRQVLGWVALFLWVLYSAKTVYDLVDADAFYQLLRTLKNESLQFFEILKNAFLQLLEMLNNAVFGHQTQDPVLPVSL
ncbi:hypothetical protein PanWU01x14_036150 [Parasponia andersonii]|uniref:Transmembrane protein n=1 Tax=Parasponia andersonii TaxID=3476 RepID=A0A2P5DSC7_PARAD|nr:hypothetical protein PanWU01x14_036150 [Parasponia andersonii]